MSLRINVGETDPEIRWSRATRRGQPSDYRPDLGPCLIYLGADNGNGYGQFSYGGRNGYAHRYAWEREHGPIPDGLTVDHLCRVRMCVEVTHLELVDAVTNFRRGKASRTACKNGHPYSDDNTYHHQGRRYCRTCRVGAWRRQGKARRKPPGTPDPRVQYDQRQVSDEIAKVRSGVQTIAQAARSIGCNPNYLGRRIWRETKRDVLERDAHCVRCGQVSPLDAHHRLPRRQGGSRDPLISFGLANLISLCRTCHDHVESHRAESYAHGWIVRGGFDPSATPVVFRGRRVFLGNDGGVSEAEEVSSDADDR